MSDSKQPRGFLSEVRNLGIRDTTDDFVCIVSEQPCVTDGVFTQSTFSGPSVAISRRHLADGMASALVTISKNANVANGQRGEEDAWAIVSAIANELKMPVDQVLLASTGVIGRPYPMDRILPKISGIAERLRPADFKAAARGIMTTDKIVKIESASIGQASLLGIAKGVGMIEPNMATLLVYFFTDAHIDKVALREAFRPIMDRTFNSLTIDTDTSTSDTALLMANGLAGTVDSHTFKEALLDVATRLVEGIVKDGEGATKMIRVRVEKARHHAEAKQIAKAVANSPLVKTAVHGADPNWGRIIMAMGKCENVTFNPDAVTVSIGPLDVYPKGTTERELAELAAILQRDTIDIRIALNTGREEALVWGCDLGRGYIDINASYAT